MKNRIVVITISAIIVLSIAYKGYAQSVALTEYFQTGYSMRHKLNPALLPQYGYVNIPALGAVSVNIGSNLGLANFLFPLSNGDLATFMHPDISDDQFLSKLKDVNYMQSSVEMSILSVGWFWGRSFWSVDISAHADINASLPYELFHFVKTEMDENPTDYKIRDIEMRVRAYSSLAIGYARAITPEWRMGAKFKFIYSGADMKLEVPQMDIHMSENQWKVMSNARATLAGGLASFTKNGDTVTGINLGFDPSSFGYGGAIDFGFEFKPNAVRGLRFSVGVTDLGFIYYKKADVQRASANGEVVFDGFDNIGTDMDATETTNKLNEDLKDMISLVEDNERRSYSSMLYARLNAGLEYDFFLDKFSVGLLSSTLFNPDRISTELTVSLNMKLLKWLSLSVSYSFLQTQQTIGWALNITPKWGLNLFLASDYTPLVTNPQYIPLNKAHISTTIGLSIPIGNNTLNHRGKENMSDEIEIGFEQDNGQTNKKSKETKKTKDSPEPESESDNILGE